MHVVLGDGTVATVGVSSIIHYCRVAQERFLEYVGAPPAESAGAPCGHCTFCRWAPFCAAEWEATSHLSIVAGMTRGHAEALRQADVTDLPALAALGPGQRVAGIHPEAFERRFHQARPHERQGEPGVRVYYPLQAHIGRGTVLGREFWLEK